MLYENISKLCTDEKTTITELERELKFGNGTIHNWKTKQATLEKAISVAAWFGVSIDDLVSENRLPTKEVREIAHRIGSYTEEQKNLILCYMSLIESGNVGKGA